MRRNGVLLRHSIPLILLLLLVTGIGGMNGDEVGLLLATDMGNVSAAQASQATLQPCGGVLPSETLEAE